jgi:hypothetical protein
LFGVRSVGEHAKKGEQKKAVIDVDPVGMEIAASVDS